MFNSMCVCICVSVLLGNWCVYHFQIFRVAPGHPRDIFRCRKVAVWVLAGVLQFGQHVYWGVTTVYL